MPGALSEFTPFGYLRNPSHRARGWGDTSGGNLRTPIDSVGLEWVYPVGRDATSRAGLRIAWDELQSRVDFAAAGLTSRYHSCLIMGFDAERNGVRFEARCFLVGDDALATRVRVRNSTVDPRDVRIAVTPEIDASAPAHAVAGGPRLEVRLEAGEERVLVTVLGRAATPEAARRLADDALGEVEPAYARLLDEDARFYATCPSLVGDWPAHWAEGLHHDFETTRALVLPAGGIFTDVWPTWMVSWPRVVLAEGTLDMLRLAYADPDLAQRAVLSLFRDAPMPNVPCVFQGGEFNMVAADGSRCGTSPAWCLPFLSLELLYLRTLDRRWLAEVFVHAAVYLDWWLANRTDAEGWIVYKCTWESGEDGNPRLDPTGSGDADIAGRVRPVELQATLAHAADVMGFFARELEQPDERWRALHAEYLDRTRQLFDTSAGRFRDWLIAERRFVEPRPQTPYWGVDACRESPQSLTPLLLGFSIDPVEVRRHARPPWSLWPSWTWSVIESASAAGMFDVVAGLAFGNVDRVYRVTTRRDVAALARPMPGSSPEFWPEDWRTYGGSDCYGWGATTANLLIRHLLGFKESRRTDVWAAELAPAIPQVLMRPGARYGIRNMNYRGRAVDLWYEVESESKLRAELDGTVVSIRPGQRLPIALESS